MPPPRKPQPRQAFHKFRANQRIRAREVLVIGPNGENFGVRPTQEALAAAKKVGLDLVEVSPTARPPVCKILDFGKFRYETAKREKDSKKSSIATKVKELKFHINTDEGDYTTKMKRAEHFLWKGMKVKIAMVMRGREMQHKDIGREVVQRIKADLEHIATPDADPKLVGRHINLMLTPLPQKKRSRKYTTSNEIIEDDEDDAQPSA